MYLFSEKYSHHIPVSIPESDYFSNYKPHNRRRLGQGAIMAVPLLSGFFGKKSDGNNTKVKYNFKYVSNNETDFKNRIDHFYKQFADSVYRATQSTETNISQTIVAQVNDIFAEKKAIISINLAQGTETQQRTDVNIKMLAEVFSNIGQNILSQMDTTFQNAVVDDTDIALKSEKSTNLVSSLLGKASKGDTVSAILSRESSLNAQYNVQRAALNEALSQVRFSNEIESTIKAENRQLITTQVAKINGEDVEIKLCVGQSIESLTEILKKCSVINKVLNIIDQSDVFGVDSETLNKFDTKTAANIQIKQEEEKVSSVFDSIGYVVITVAVLVGLVILGYLILKFVR